MSLFFFFILFIIIFCLNGTWNQACGGLRFIDGSVDSKLEFIVSRNSEDHKREHHLMWALVVAGRKEHHLAFALVLLVVEWDAWELCLWVCLR